jgi:hypothetical protein
MSECKDFLKNCVVFHSRDWSHDKRDACIYGIIVGWDDECLEELKLKHRWHDEQLSRLKRLRAEFVGLGEAEENPTLEPVPGVAMRDGQPTLVKIGKEENYDGRLYAKPPASDSPAWIRIEDSLPNELRFVLLVIGFDESDIKQVVHHGYYLGAGSWSIMGSIKTKTKEAGLISGVTHWMPLPEPPKEEQK